VDLYRIQTRGSPFGVRASVTQRASGASIAEVTDDLGPVATCMTFDTRWAEGYSRTFSSFGRFSPRTSAGSQRSGTRIHDGACLAMCAPLRGVLGSIWGIVAPKTVSYAN
jgi:hypothetical protein